MQIGAVAASILKRTAAPQKESNRRKNQHNYTKPVNGHLSP